MSTLERKRRGSADIAAELRRAITGGSLQLNDPLPAERQLAATYGVSRGTVREAIGRLERENLVQSRRGSGTYVVHAGSEPASALFESARPLELIDARFALEPHICRLAVLHGRRTDFDRLGDLLEAMDRSVDRPDSFSELDADFHARLAAATGNRLLTWIIGQVNLVRSREEWLRMRHLTLEHGIIEEYNRQHRDILGAIVARDGDHAAALMMRHLETARLSLTRAMAT